jgi:predicted Zn-dependent protease
MGRIDAHAVLEAMQAELDRSMTGLRVPGSPEVYHLVYGVRRRHAVILRASHGSLLRDRTTTEAKLGVEVRVGDHSFDNVLDGGLNVVADERESAEWTAAPDDLDPTELRVALWKLTQIKFDEAQEDYYDHRKAMVAEYLRDEVDAFTRERPLVHVDPVHDEPLPADTWRALLGDLSRRFLSCPDVFDPGIGLRMERLQRWLVTSDGTRVVTEDRFYELVVEGWVLSEDGVYVQGERALWLRDAAQLPDRARLEAMVDAVLTDLDRLRTAESPGSFVGPALLSGQAASTIFHEALGHRLEGERLVARGETRTFARRLGDRILPPGIDVYDDPTRSGPDGRPLWGSYAVDDEGVPAQRADLVRDGVLCGFLRSRTPIPGGERSSGHGRSDGVEKPMARMGVLVVEADGTAALSRAELEAELIALARRQGRRQAVIVERIRAGETSTNSYEFQVFKGELSEVWLLDVETGERRRIRDIELIGTPLAAMQRVVAFGGDPGQDHGYCVAESGAIPVSGIAPAILVSEVELQQRSTTGFHEPLLPPPFADDGSRGRVGGRRERGRRKRR